MWALLFFFALVDASTGGAANCNAKVVPSMGGTESSAGWSVTASPAAFAANTPITVTINGPGGAIVKGLSMYTESAAGALFGSWNSATNFKPNTNCANSNGVTHNNNNNKALPLTFVWNAPATNPGVSTLTIRALNLYTSMPYTWSIVSTTISNNFSTTTSAPTPATTTAPTAAPSPATTGAPSNAVTSAPTTLAPTSAAPTFGACMDGIKGPGEIAVDCGGPCPPCPNYTWVPDNWTPCSKPCDGGTQTRVVRCVDGTTGNTTDPSNCASLHPAETSMTCNPDPCANYSWSIGPWGACSSACNTGIQTRTVTCQSSIGNSTVADSNCGSGTKPVTDQNCNTDPCLSSRWVSQPWGLCSATCGGGSQTRLVQCQNTANTVVMDSDCMGTPKPDTQQICGNITCEVYVWSPCPTFYPCTASCYGGTGMLGVRYKDVFCVAISNLQAVDVSLCDVGTKPVTNYSSCNPNRCTGFNWMANANWGPCEATSGRFVRTRSFHCHAADGSVALSTACQGVPLPVAELPCTPNTCLKNVPDMVSSASFTAASLLTAALVFLSQ